MSAFLINQFLIWERGLPTKALSMERLTFIVVWEALRSDFASSLQYGQ
jgi:hypothetical protein